jgi:hypothetical protein
LYSLLFARGSEIAHVGLRHAMPAVVAAPAWPDAAAQIVYVAPMKALAAEVTANFGKRLAALGLTVRELTGARLGAAAVHRCCTGTFSCSFMCGNAGVVCA